MADAARSQSKIEAGMDSAAIKFLTASTITGLSVCSDIKISSQNPIVIYRSFCYQASSNPRRSAIITACVRSLAPSLLTRFLMWKLTVVSAIASRSAICLLR
jgi:hypothetical protein